MRRVVCAVKHWISHGAVGRSHVDLGAQAIGANSRVALAKRLEDGQVGLWRRLAMLALRVRHALGLHSLLIRVVHVGEAFVDHGASQFLHLGKVVARVRDLCVVYR